MEKVVIYGSGQVGKNLALKFAGLGVETVLFCRDIQKVSKEMKIFIRIAKKMNKELDLINNEVIITDKLSDLLHSDLVIESVSEKLDIKKDALNDIKDIVDEHTIVATTTSTQSITELANYVKFKDNFLGLHFFNPPTVINFLEVIKGEYTSESTTSSIINFLECKNIKFIVTRKENPGFIVNRALFLMLNEAIYELDEQLATTKEIDMAFKLGLNHPMGPLELCDFIGLDIVLDILTTLYEEYNDTKYRPCFLLKQKVRANKLGKKTKEGFYIY